MEGGERVKDDGVLEKFEVDLAEAQNMVMTARIMLGWVDPDDLASNEELSEEVKSEK
jgi:N utilization substance protein A